MIQDSPRQRLDRRSHSTLRPVPCRGDVFGHLRLDPLDLAAGIAECRRVGRGTHAGEEKVARADCGHSVLYPVAAGSGDDTIPESLSSETGGHRNLPSNRT
jgi:hypothetical protein